MMPTSTGATSLARDTGDQGEAAGRVNRLKQAEKFKLANAVSAHIAGGLDKFTTKDDAARAFANMLGFAVTACNIRGALATIGATTADLIAIPAKPLSLEDRVAALEGIVATLAAKIGVRQ